MRRPRTWTDSRVTVFRGHTWGQVANAPRCIIALPTQPTYCQTNDIWCRLAKKCKLVQDSFCPRLSLLSRRVAGATVWAIIYLCRRPRLPRQTDGKDASMNTCTCEFGGQPPCLRPCDAREETVIAIRTGCGHSVKNQDAGRKAALSLLFSPALPPLPPFHPLSLFSFRTSR